MLFLQLQPMLFLQLQPVPPPSHRIIPCKFVASSHAISAAPARPTAVPPDHPLRSRFYVCSLLPCYFCSSSPSTARPTAVPPDHPLRSRSSRNLLNENPSISEMLSGKKTHFTSISYFYPTKVLAKHQLSRAFSSSIKNRRFLSSFRRSMFRCASKKPSHWKPSHKVVEMNKLSNCPIVPPLALVSFFPLHARWIVFLCPAIRRNALWLDARVWKSELLPGLLHKRLHLSNLVFIATS